MCVCVCVVCVRVYIHMRMCMYVQEYGTLFKPSSITPSPMPEATDAACECLWEHCYCV